MKRGEERLSAWDALLSAGARLQKIVPGAVLVGGTAAAVFARHRFSFDADHVVTDLKARFDEVLGDLEQVAGWTTARVKRPVLILGSLDGIETGIRQLIRTEPLETCMVPSAGPGSAVVAVPTPAEILRIKAALVLKRNATRDYVDLAALSKHLGPNQAVSALRRFDDLYPQPNGQSATQQLLVQLVDARPYDLIKTNLESYKGLADEWHSWLSVEEQLKSLAGSLFINRLRDPQNDDIGKPDRSSTGAPDDEEVRRLTEEVSWIGEGRAVGKIRFNWDFLEQGEKERRLASLDLRPEAFKAALERVWKERDPGGFAAWEARGRRPSDRPEKSQPVRSVERD